MIISDRHRYLYVELPRTGSSAVSAELQANYDGELILRKHATYGDFLRLATDDQKSYFAFSGIRNPLDVAVTRYVHIRADSKGHFTDPAAIARRNTLASRIERRIFSWVQRTDASFEQFLRRWYVLPYDTWASLDHQRMDFIIRFESLDEDFAEAIRRIGLEPVRPLPVVNATPERGRDFVSYYTPAAIRRAAWVFGPYMEQWGYAFPADWGRIRIPWWSRVLFRVARVPRAIYWRFFRFSDYVRRQPGGMTPISRQQGN